jgi:hypothetical protein
MFTPGMETIIFMTLLGACAALIAMVFRYF